MSIKELWSKYSNGRATIISGAAVLGIASLLSRLLGLVRDRLFASEFGAGMALDVYFAAFRVPDFIFNLLVLGALSSSFIPVFGYYLVKGRQKEAFRVANSVASLLVIIVAGVSAIVFIFAPGVVNLVVPSFGPDEKAMVAKLTRIMLLSPIFFCLSNIFSGVLNSFRRFFAYSLAPIFYNLAIIGGAIFLAPKYGVEGLAWGVVAGSLLHWLVQIPSARRVGFRLRPVFDWGNRGVKKMVKLMAPRALGLAGMQVNLWAITVIAASLRVGSLSIFNFANNLQSLPVGLIGISFSMAAFPFLTSSSGKEDAVGFRIHFSKAFRQIVFYLVPASVLLLILRAQIVRLVLGAGKFDWEDTILTAQSLGFFTIGILAQGLIPLLAKSFYAKQDTKTPVIITFAAVAINIGLSIWLSGIMGVLGLALAFSISSNIQMLLLLTILRTRVGNLDDAKIIWGGLKVVFMSLVMGVGVYVSLRVVAPLVDMQTFLGIAIQTGVALVVAGLSYFGLGFLFGCEELMGLRQIIGVPPRRRVKKDE